MSPARQELENEWSGRLRDARLSLDLAQAHLREIRKKSGSTLSEPLADAIRDERAALTDYLKVLKIFADLVVHAIVPAGKSGCG